jgi:mycofactocin system FadH/OYE family oxidoreductase 2
MADALPHLFSPIQVGSTTIRNRILMTAHLKLFAVDNMLSEQHAYYYAERAKGGIGLIVTEQQSVHPTSNGGFPEICFGFKEEAVEKYRMVSDMVHQYGAKIFAQIWHCGQHQPPDTLDNPTQTWAPSALPCVAWHTVPKELEEDDIREIIAGFAKVARHAQLGGMDGVEIHGAHSYLVHQFWSPLYNRRTDKWGGSLDNRLRFSIEVLEAVRKAVGTDFTVGIRVSGDELFPTGLTVEDMQEICARLEATGTVDFFDVSGGNYHTIPIMVGPMEIPPKPFVSFAAAIKERLERTPVFVADRINDPRVAEGVLADGHADMCAMTRATLCDAELPNKAKEGRLEDIRYCMACNQACIARLWDGKKVGCVQNPSASREKLYGIGTLTRAPRKKRVVIVGGGVAGMKAAEIAVERGHDVVLLEKSGELGGQVNIARLAPTRDEFWECVRYMKFRMQKLDVPIRLNTDASADAVLALSPDVVIVATGAAPLKNGVTSFWPYELPGWQQDNVVTAEDVYLGRADVGKNVLVYEDTNHHRGVGVCEFLADRGRTVEVITRHPYVGMDLGLTLNQPIFYKRFFEKGIVMTPHHAVKSIDGRRVTVFNIYTNQERSIDGVDTVVMATVRKSCDELYFALKGRVADLRRVGDCVQPRTVLEAFWEGFVAGREL